MKMNGTQLAIAVILLSLGLLVLACPPSTLPPGGRWEANENCTSGPNFLTLTPPRERCHCWGHCGYICTPEGTNATITTTLATTARSTTTAKSVATTKATTVQPSTTKRTTTQATTTTPGRKCPYGGVWFNPQGQRCRCQSFNQQSYYVCETTSTSTSPAATSTTATSTSTAATATSTTTAAASTTTAAASTTTAATSTSTTAATTAAG